MDVRGDGIGDMEAGVMGDSGDDTEAGDRGELQGVSPDNKHLTYTFINNIQSVNKINNNSFQYILT